MPVDTYRSQRRGGRGNPARVRDGDFVEDIMTTSTHDNILFFTNKDKMFKLKGYQFRQQQEEHGDCKSARACAGRKD